MDDDEVTAAAALECRVLGEPEIRVRGVVVPLRAAKVKALVATLLVRADRTATVEGLLDDLWPEGCPRSAVANLRTYATQVRRCLPRGRLQTVGSGYRLLTHEHEVDLTRARALAARGRAAVDAAVDGRDLAAALPLLEAACAEWRGRPLEGLVLGSRLEAVRTALEDEHRAVTELRLRVALALGRGGEVVAAARAHAATNPLAESAQELLMLALWHVGDHGGALRVYAAARATLVGELGIEPGAGLQRVQRGILLGDVAPSALPGFTNVVEVGVAEHLRATPEPRAHDGRADPSAGQPAPAPTPPSAQAWPQGSTAPSRAPHGAAAHVALPHPVVPHGAAARSGVAHGPVGHPLAPHAPEARGVVPHEVPAPPALLVGVDEAVQLVVRALDGSGGPRVAPVVVAVHGPSGAGTSSVVAAGARAVAAHYPDGQVYLDLQHGRRDPATLVEGALRSLGAERGPSAPLRCDAPARLRSTLHGRRVLLVVDNAVDAAQALALLPGDASSAVLVACRALPATLVSAVDVAVPTLGEADAIGLFEAAARRSVTGPERAVAARVVRRCDLRPQQVCLAGARLAGRPDLSLEDLERALVEESSRSASLPSGNVVALPPHARAHESMLHDPPQHHPRLLDPTRDPELHDAVVPDEGELLAAVVVALGRSSRNDLTRLVTSRSDDADVVAEALGRLVGRRAPGTRAEPPAR
ncbi:hypothetical protein CPE01_29770 [Cellulomonas persica]|uniref:OmpR/PhoB-type domain-containing protein n=2 Tax=Cellulomonas persica TaxID=76861 RepID=A0A510UX26_9CELL|nr:hypothetical protein CPE01_29770 [Cellulomonas persica]